MLSAHMENKITPSMPLPRDGTKEAGGGKMLIQGWY
jgi:hypothetical protein